MWARLCNAIDAQLSRRLGWNTDYVGRNGETLNDERVLLLSASPWDVEQQMS